MKKWCKFTLVTRQKKLIVWGYLFTSWSSFVKQEKRERKRNRTNNKFRHYSKSLQWKS